MRPLRRAHVSVGLFFFLTWLLGALWALATPVMGVPDEPAHVIRAASVVRGQILPTSTVEEDGERVDFARVPRTLAFPERPCYAQNEDLTPACDVAPPGRGDDLVEVESRLQRNNPVYYAFVGPPTLVAPGKTTVYAMRLMTAAFVAALIALAAIALVESATPRWALVGLAAAITPMVLFLAGSVNPNAVEIAAGLALWATLLSWFSRPRRDIDRSRAARAAIAGGVLGVSRPLSPIFLVLIVLGSLLLLERGAVREVWRVGRVPGCVVAGVSMAGLGWTLAVGTIATGSRLDFPEYQSVRHYAFSVLSSLHDYERQMIGVFGWLDTQAGAHVYTLWLAIVGFLVLAALSIGRTRERLLLIGLLALSVVFPLVLQYPAAQELGIIWQGRYLLPLMVGLPISAAWVLGSSERWNALMAGRWPFWAPVGTLAVLQVGAYWWALHRNLVGSSDTWFGLTPLWQPPIGWVPLALAYAAVVAAWTVALACLEHVGRDAAVTANDNERVSVEPVPHQAQ